MTSILLLLTAIASVHAQTYSGCHNHSSVEYCYGSDGSETPVFTYSQTGTATLPATVAASTTSTGQTAAVTGCHNHGSDVYCIDSDGHEVQVSLTATPTGELPAQYTGCHTHGSDQYCLDPDGNDVQILEEGASASEETESESSGESGGENCHFHAGVEHCVGAGESESSSTSSCNVRDRDYDLPLRIGTLFVILVTSAIGVFAPMLLAKLPFQTLNSMVSTVIKQFGTGVIISTAFVHLYTHATLMFTNNCLGELEYEATTSAVVMAGIFISFLIEYIGHRIILARAARASSTETESASQAVPKDSRQHQQTSALTQLSHNHGPSDPTKPDTKFSVLVMEAGVIFHSVIIGVTLVVAGDSFYKTLLVVIVFHQFFEGLALGARIAMLPGKILPTKALMAGAFALVTPVGMAIGMGVLHSFNGNDRDTLIALGTLDALSAGILVWVGVVDMWARDWVIEGGEMMDASIGKVMAGGISLIAGMVLMGVLGKWA